MAKSAVLIGAFLLVLTAVFIVNGETNGSSPPNPRGKFEQKHPTPFYYNHEPVDTLYFVANLFP